MIKFFIRLALTALAFMFVLPHIHGIQFHGDFGHALLSGFVFALLCTVADLATTAIGIGLAVTVPILGLLATLLIFICAFWLVPALGLMWMASVMPHTLAVSGFAAAAVGGLVMFLVGVVGHLFTN